MIEDFELNDAEFEFSYEIVVDRYGKIPIVDIHSYSELDIQDFEDFSTVPPLEILKKAGLIKDASASQPTKRHRIVRFDAATVEEQERVHAAKTTPSSSSKSVRQDNSDEKWVKLFLQSYNVEECSEDTVTVRLNALVESVVNQKLDNFTIETSSTVHIHKDHMDIEGVSVDIEPATLEALVKPVENQKPDNANVETSSTVHIHKDQRINL
ncbi:hypothetical protein FXO37_25631 [Capsicum annuum]|nr:hypothetical protein FXO37_25631 [Capsicum annuum]